MNKRTSTNDKSEEPLELCHSLPQHLALSGDLVRAHNNGGVLIATFTTFILTAGSASPSSSPPPTLTYGTTRYCEWVSVCVDGSEECEASAAQLCPPLHYELPAFLRPPAAS